jgi:hypothetical protein
MESACLCYRLITTTILEERAKVEKLVKGQFEYIVAIVLGYTID